MTTVTGSLFAALPKPKYTGEEEEIPQHAQQRGPRILGAGALDDTQMVFKVNLHALLPYSNLLINLNLEIWTSTLW
jgi:hypothetical protein